MNDVDVISVLKFFHLFSAIFMAWPFYALVAVNQRIKLGPPLGDRTDVYMENIVKNRTIPCFIFQITALVTGVALVLVRGLGWGVFFTNAALSLKFGLLVVVMGLLMYAYKNLQPKIDALFASHEGTSIPDDAAKEIGALRGQRKRLASVCMFLVLIVAMLGMQVWVPFPLWLTLVLTAGIGLFTWRAFTSETPYGWA